MRSVIYWFRRRNIDQNFKPVIMVTGCNRGIGLAIAELLYHRHEYRVIATVREKSLSEAQEKFPPNDRFRVLPMDVTSEEDRVRLIRDVEKLWGGVDVLINNAGISYRSVVEHMTDEDEKLQLATNYLGPMSLIRLCAPHMRNTGRGKIINISSVSGMLAMPTMASYTASKFALEGASEALWYEMRPFGVRVVLVQPGFIHSDSFKNVYHTKLSDPSESGNGPYCDFYQNMAPFVGKMMNLSRTTPEKVAQQILNVIKTENPPLWIPVTLDAIVFYYLRRLLPRRLLLPFLFWCLPNARHWAQKHTRRRR